MATKGATKKGAATKASRGATTQSAGRQSAAAQPAVVGVRPFVFRDTADNPTLISQGSGWILLAAPLSDEETTRIECKINRYRRNANGSLTLEVTVAEGSTLEPFDGSSVLDNFTPALQAGVTYVYRAEARYDPATTPDPLVSSGLSVLKT